MDTFKAYRIEQAGRGPEMRVAARFVQMDETELDAGDVLIRVEYSAVNEKDALAATGRGQVMRRLPCVGGIDLAGTVLRSAAPHFQPGDKVLATGYALGVSHHGGFAERALVPGGWVLPVPAGLSTHEAMALGSAGLTVAMAINRMEDNGLKPENGPVIVTAAEGAAGALAVDMLSGRGYEVVALSTDPEQAEWLRSLGAARSMTHSKLSLDAIKPLDKGFWAGAVDGLGGNVLAWLLSSTKPTGVVASIGLADDTVVNTSVMPFVLRGISLLGVDSVYAGFAARERAWARLGADLRPRHLRQIACTIGFNDLPDVFEATLAERLTRRTVVQIAP